MEKSTIHPWLALAEPSQLVLPVTLWHVKLVRLKARPCTRKDGTHPDCGWRKESAGITQFAVVCKAAWFIVFSLTPAAFGGARVSDSGGRRERDEGRAFDDVNFPAGRPRARAAQSPKCGPSGTSHRHVRYIEDDDRIIVHLLRMDADAGTPTGGRIDNGHIVRAHNELVALH